MSVLAIDQGTSGTKAIVVDESGEVLSVAERSVRATYLPGGGVEIDPLQLLASVLDAGRDAIDRANTAVAGVALANQGETVLAWDPVDGAPLSSAIVWQDRRAEPICAELGAGAEAVAARTGLRLDPYFSAPKMVWIRRNVTADGVVTTTDTWLVNQLCGAFVTDVSTAGRSLLVDIDTCEWDPQLVDLFGLGGERLPEVVGCDQAVGVTDVWGPAMTVGGLIVDQQAALLAQRCLERGATKCTFGTGAFLLANTGQHAVRSRSGLTSSTAWRIAGRTAYCLDAQVYTAGSAVRWLKELGLIGDVTSVDAAAADDAGGVVCIPALAGLGAPWWRPDAQASFSGMTLSTRGGHLVTAVLEGLAAQVAEMVDLVEAELGVALGRLRVDGGLTRSRRLMQATADLLQRPVEVYPSAHVTALGAGAVGRLALDATLGLSDAVPIRTPAKVYEPQWSQHRVAAFRDRWRFAACAVLGVRST